MKNFILVPTIIKLNLKTLIELSVYFGSFLVELFGTLIFFLRLVFNFFFVVVAFLHLWSCLTRTQVFQCDVFVVVVVVVFSLVNCVLFPYQTKIVQFNDTFFLHSFFFVCILKGPKAVRYQVETTKYNNDFLCQNNLFTW